MSDRLISLSQAERAMKLQEVILKAMAGDIKWYQAAEIIGISCRQMRRLKKRYIEHGYDGLLDRRKNTPSPRRIPFETAQKVLRLYRTQYRGFNVKHFHEEMTANHDIDVSYSWTKNLLQESGLVEKHKKRGQYRRRRPRKACTGMLMHLDGSEHRWFEHPTDERQCLVVMLDDATSKVVCARIVPEESTEVCLEVLKEVVEAYGTFASLYTDRASHFVYTPEAGGKPDRDKPTQVEQVLDDLGIELIVAYSPEARGRGERVFGTFQGRLPQELSRANITTYREANRYLNEVYLPKHNANFSVDPMKEMTAFLPAVGVNLERIIAWRFERTVQRDNTIEFENRRLQLSKVEGHSTLAGRNVTIRKHLDGILEILIGNRLIATFEPDDKHSIEVKQETIG